MEKKQILELKLEKAFHGDCIWLRYGKDTFTNIIIDSGPKNFKKGFTDLINKIYLQGEILDLLILTHIDDDHIGGFLKFISEHKSKINLIKKVLFNGQNNMFYESNELHTPDSANKISSFLKANKVDVLCEVCDGYSFEINDAKFKIISPTKDNMALIDNKIQNLNTLHNGGIDNCDIDKIIDVYKNDARVENKASIAFVMTYCGKNYAFLGDADAESVETGLDKYFNQQEIYITKISHHGSANNLTDSLLKKLKCSEFLLSTNKSRSIGKVIFKRIANSLDKCTIYCNYDWWSDSNYFTGNDKSVYINKNKINLIFQEGKLKF